MRRTLARMLTLLAAFVVVAFVVVLINQTAQLIALAGTIHPLVGQGVLWALLFVYAACVFVPLFLFLRLPRPLVPPDENDEEAVEAHVARLAERLARNPEVLGAQPKTREEVEAALASLETKANALTREAASQVFLTTAISQNGALDAVVVLAAQSRLILRIARLYWQRPTIRDMTHLYANVAATALIATELEEIDLSEQMQPVISAVLGSAAGAIPGFQTAAGVVVNSVMTGSANAFLTLRVGIIARQYCAAVVKPPRGITRRSAALAATHMLGGIAMEGARRVASAVWTASRRTVGGTVTGMAGSVKRTGAALFDRLRPGMPPDDEPAGGT